jgi:putative spermidine/putrescine transport system substrate-binding protein
MNKIVRVLAVVIIAAVAAASFFAFQQPPRPPPTSELAGNWDEILQKAREQGQLNIFVANDLGIQPFLEKNVIPEFSSRFGVKVSISSGHWSGAVQKLVSERAGGVARGSYDLVIFGDEAMARSLESGVLVQNMASKIPNAKNLAAIPDGRMHGIEVQGKAVPIKIEQYVLVFNSDFLDAKELFKNMDDLDEWLKEHPGRFAVSDPMKTDSGLAALFMGVYGEQGYSKYAGKPYNRSLETAWPEIVRAVLGLEEEEGPEEGGEEEAGFPNEADLLKTVAGGENWVGILRMGIILNTAKAGTSIEGVKTFLPEDGSLVSITSAGVPVNSQRKEAALVFLDYLLSKEVQLKIIESLGSYPAIEIAESDIPSSITKLPTWIQINEAKEKRLGLPHYSYRTDMLDLVRKLTGD